MIAEQNRKGLRFHQRIRLRSIVKHLLIMLFCFIMIYPIIWLISSSFKTRFELAQNPAGIIPLEFTFSNYVEGWRGFGNTTFATFMRNSLFLSIVGTVFQVVSSTAAAYGFARLEFKGSKLLFGIMIVTMLLPTQIMLIPQYIIMSRVGWANTYLPLLIPMLGGRPFFIFLCMQFFYGLPYELDEAAEIDGCNKYSTFLRILAPLLVPVIITQVIFSFYWKWQEFLEPMLYLSDVKKYTMSIALNLFSDPTGVSNWGAIYAMSVVSFIPVFLIFIFFQKYLVEGIATSGLKE